MSISSISHGELNAWVVGYISRNLLLGKYSSLSSVDLGRPADNLAVHRLAEVVFSLLRWHESDLRSEFGRMRRRPEGGDEMRMVLQQLSEHSKPLSAALYQNAKEELPDLAKETSSLFANPPFTPFGREDAQVLALAQWFKSTYMRWVDPIPCNACQGKTKGVGSAEPTVHERMEGGGRVELHQCEACGTVVRFVRYGDPMTLMRERRGRCGEWAHLFYVFLLASGLKARYIWNSEDHVWTEYWSPTLNHWVHVDSCEATISKPLLYARGWGKKQAFCIAVGDDGAEDVTRAYVDDWQACLQRRDVKKWGDSALQLALMEMTVRLRSRMTLSQQHESEDRDRGQASWMGDDAVRWREAEKADLGGRVSGPEDWRAARDELGGDQKVAIPEHKVLRILSVTAPEDLDYILTNKPDQVGHIFPPVRIPRRMSWLTTLEFRLTAPYGQAGADGIAVFFASEQKVGLGGYGLGYSGIGTTGDFAVEADPAVPHISVHSPPDAHHRYALASTREGALPSLNDGRLFVLKLLFDGRDRKLWGSLVVKGEDEHLPLWDVYIPAPEGDVGKEDWWFGITGSCGGLWQKQEIALWRIEAVEIDREVSQSPLPDVAANESV